MTWPKGVSGNPTGKPIGAMAIRSKAAQKIFENHNFDSLEEGIKLAKDVIVTIATTKNPDERVDYQKLLFLLLNTLLKYQYPQLRHVEHAGDVDVNVNVQAVLTEALTRAYGDTPRPVLVPGPGAPKGSRTARR